MDRHSEHGNVLFLILIAVMLFAALSYAVTSSTRSGSGSTERENERLNSSSMANYIVGLKSSVTRLIAHGCQTSELSFERSPFDGSDTDYVNPSSPSDFSCHVFHPNGGGYFWRDASGILNLTSGVIIDEMINSANHIQDVGSTCGQSNCSELLYLVRFNSSNEGAKICTWLNDYFDIENPGGSPPSDSNIAADLVAHKFTGTFSVTAGLGDTGQAPELHGRYTGCFQETSGVFSFFFYHVLLAR